MSRPLRYGLSLALVALAMAPAAPARAQEVGCSWPLRSDLDTLNVAFPDESATYWATRFTSVPGTSLVISGAYPFARYFSFHAYDEPQRPVGSLADIEIDPDPGSGNPFRDATAPVDVEHRRYTVRVEFTAAPADPAPNTFYAGATQEGSPNPAGFIIYRVYVPDDPADLAGGVPLPSVTLEGAGGAVAVPFGQCEPLPPSTGGQLNETIKDSDFPDEVPRVLPFPGATNPPSFERFFGVDRAVWNRVPSNPVTDPLPRSRGGFYSNEHIAYMTGRISRQWGDVFVMRARAPTFPDTRAGVPVTTSAQLRYWSVCQNEFATQRFVACTADYQTPLDDQGFFTIVISDPTDRPANATDENKVRWLPWGGAYYDGLVIYRHMLADAGFAQAIQDVPEGTPALTVLGEYYPRTGYCEKAAFEESGAACLGP